MTPNRVLIVCACAPNRVSVVAVRHGNIKWPAARYGQPDWRCSWCGARVKVVA